MMGSKYRSAKLLLRFLAWQVDWWLWFLPFILSLLYVAGSTSASDLGYRIILSLTLLLALWIFGIFYATITTYYWGGNIGKLLTGLRVTDENDSRLSFRRLLFRHLIGYQFASLLFGLGFFAIIKDANKQGWHDKTVGSKIVVVQNLWPIALVVLLLLIVVNSIATVNMISQFSNNTQIKQVFSTLSENKLPNELPDYTPPKTPTL